MEKQLIYLVNEDSPYTIESLADKIISEAVKIEGKLFEEFKEPFENRYFKNYSKEKKEELLKEQDDKLKKGNKFRATWNNRDNVISDVLKGLEFILQSGDERSVLTKRLERLMPGLIEEAAHLNLLHKKLNYITITFNNLQANLIHYPEKWYALLHMILIDLGQKDPIIDLSDMKGIKSIGISDYKLQSTGRIFYNEIKNISTCKREIYIANLNESDRKKWKKIIAEISGNDSDVIIHLKKLPA